MQTGKHKLGLTQCTAEMPLSQVPNPQNAHVFCMFMFDLFAKTVHLGIHWGLKYVPPPLSEPLSWGETRSQNTNPSKNLLVIIMVYSEKHMGSSRPAPCCRFWVAFAGCSCYSVFRCPITWFLTLIVSFSAQTEICAGVAPAVLGFDAQR